jgi:citrate lyase subunit beta/citryl-CoA lyase
VNLRALLFVPGDSERKLAKAEAIGADALILDLEDAVAAERRPQARGMVLEYLSARRGARRPELWVRVNPLDTSDALADLAAVVAGAPDGIVVPKTDSAADVIRLDHYLAALEAREGVPIGSTRILPVATETARALFHLDSYAGASGRLHG